MKILIVDDSKLSRNMCKKSLPEIHNYEIFEAVNGEDGVEKYKECSPAITFMDLTMPVKTGFEATKEIMEFDKDAYIVVVTADIQHSAEEKVLGLGAKKLVKKPIDDKKMEEIFLDFNRDFLRKGKHHA